MNTKLYICVREDVPDHMVPVLVAHAVIRHHIYHIDLPDIYERQYQEWLVNSFKKCVVKMNMKEFMKVRDIEGTVESLENSTCNGEVTCVTIIDMGDKTPNVLKFAKMWRPLCLSVE